MNSDATQPPPLPAESSLAARLANVFIAPGEVFGEIKSRPVRHANWLVPALIFVIVGWVVGALLFSSEPIQQQLWEIQQQALTRQSQSQKLSQAQMDQIKSFMKVGQVIGYFVAPVGQAAMKLFGGGFVLWLGALLVLRRKLDYLKAVEIAGLALMVGAVGELVRGLLCVAQGTMFSNLGPVLFIQNFNPENPLHTALLAVQVFVLWMIMVRSVGLAKLCEVSFVRAFVWVLSIWLLWSAGSVLLGWAGQKVAAAMTGQH